MTKETLLAYVRETYSAEPDCPWQDNTAAVLRHVPGRRWFGLVMTIPRSRLGLPGEEAVDVLNVKCDPVLAGTMRQRPGIHPAYHMNKEHWLSVRLDGSASDGDIRFLLDRSWQLTGGKKR